MITVVMFLWYDVKGAYNRYYQYGPDDVNTMVNMIDRHLTLDHQFVCVTDMPEGIDPRVKIHPVDWSVHVGGRRFQKLMAFQKEARQWAGDRIFMTDLDNVIVGNIDAIVRRPEEIVLWHDEAYILGPGTTRYGRYNTSIALMDAGCRAHVWDSFDVSIHPQRLLRGSDQAWVSRVLGPNEAYWNERQGVYKGRLLRGELPSNARIVCLNGCMGPRMAETRKRLPWIEEYWQ